MKSLLQHTVRAAVAGEIGEQQLANVVYGGELIGVCLLLDELFASLARVAQQRVCKFDGQQLANTA